MIRRTQSITVEITVISKAETEDEFIPDDVVTETVKKSVKEALDADDVIVTSIKNFDFD